MSSAVVFFKGAESHVFELDAISNGKKLSISLVWVTSDKQSLLAKESLNTKSAAAFFEAEGVSGGGVSTTVDISKIERGKLLIIKLKGCNQSVEYRCRVVAIDTPKSTDPCFPWRCNEHEHSTIVDDELANALLIAKLIDQDDQSISDHEFAKSLMT